MDRFVDYGLAARDDRPPGVDGRPELNKNDRRGSGWSWQPGKIGTRSVNVRST